MEVGRIQTGFNGISPVERVNTVTSPVRVANDVGDITAEMRSSLALNKAPGVSSLVLDAFEDNIRDLRVQVVSTIKHQVDMGKLNENARLLRQQLKANPNVQEFIEEFRRNARNLSRGSTAYELAMIDALQHIDKDSITSLFSDDFVRYFIQNYESELRAYLNISDVIQSHLGKAEGEELAGAYEEILVQSQSLLQALGTITRRLGVDTMASWLPFLTQGAVADLVSPHLGADKIHLMFILNELKSFRVLNTFKGMLSEVEQRHLQGKKVSNYLLTSFEYTEQPIATIGLIERWVNACTTQEQILFFQDYRRVFSKITDEAYKDEEQRHNVLSVLQRKIDDMVYNEGD